MFLGVTSLQTRIRRNSQLLIQEGVLILAAFRLLASELLQKDQWWVSSPILWSSQPRTRHRLVRTLRNSPLSSRGRCWPTTHDSTTNIKNNWLTFLTKDLILPFLFHSLHTSLVLRYMQEFKLSSATLTNLRLNFQEGDSSRLREGLKLH